MISLQCITYQKRDNVAEVVHHQHNLRMLFQKILGNSWNVNVTVDEREKIDNKWLQCTSGLGPDFLTHYKATPEGPQLRRVQRFVAQQNPKTPNTYLPPTQHKHNARSHTAKTSLKAAYLVLWIHDHRAHAIRTGQRDNSK